jgi:hypothetical protein
MSESLYEKTKRIREMYELETTKLHKDREAMQFPFKSIRMQYTPRVNLKECIIHGIMLEHTRKIYETIDHMKWHTHLLDNWDEFEQVDKFALGRCHSFVKSRIAHIHRKLLPEYLERSDVEKALRLDEKQYNILTHTSYLETKLAHVRGYWKSGPMTFSDIDVFCMVLSNFITTDASIPFLHHKHTVHCDYLTYPEFDVWLWNNCEILWVPENDEEMWVQLQNIYNLVMDEGIESYGELAKNFSHRFPGHTKTMTHRSTQQSQQDEDPDTHHTPDYFAM